MARPAADEQLATGSSSSAADIVDDGISAATPSNAAADAVVGSPPNSTSAASAAATAASCAVHQRRHLVGEGPLREPRSGASSCSAMQPLDLVERLQRELSSWCRRPRRRRLHPELAELVRAWSSPASSHTAPPSDLPNFVPSLRVSSGPRERVHVLGALAADQIDPGDDVAPLVGAADLQLDAVVLVQQPEVVGLQEHVAELGVRDAVLAVDAQLDRLLGQHLVDGDVLADVAEELEHRDRLRSSRRCRPASPHGPGSKSSDPAELHLDARHVVVAGCRRRAGCAPRCARSGRRPCRWRRRRAANGRCPASWKRRSMTEPDEVADVQGVGRRVEAEVDADRALGQPRHAVRHGRSSRG